MQSSSKRCHLAILMAGVLVVFLSNPWSAHAVSVTVDEVICDEVATPGCTGLSGTVDIDQIDANTLQWTVTNASTATDDDAEYLLSGVGYQTGLSFDASGSSIALNGASEVNGADASFLDDQWGHTDIAEGPFAELVTGGTVDSAFSTLVAAVNSGETFNGVSMTPPANVNGPSDGIFSSSAIVDGGQAGYQDHLVFTIGYDSDATSLFNSLIGGQNYVVLSFGSPAAAVPEPSTLLLLGMGFAGIFAWGWRKDWASRG